MQILKAHGVDLQPIEKELETLRHLIALRDCVVHANGEIAACTDQNRIRLAIAAIDTAESMSDGFLYLGDQVIPEAQICKDRILRHLFSHFDYPLSWS